MLEVNVNSVAWMNGSEHVQAFLMERGLTAREARTLTHPKKMRQVRDSLLQRLCEGLLCTPNDVFRWTGPKESLLSGLNTGTATALVHQLKAMREPKDAERLLEKALKVLEEEPEVKRMHGGRLFINVRRLLEQRGVKKLHRELKRMGFTHGEAAGLLSERRRSIKLKLLKRLCEAFHCLPNELYDFEGPEGHVLEAVRKAPVVSLDARLKGLSEAQLRRVLEAVEKDLR